MKNRGFTLVEIVIAMTILGLISGTVMAILVQAGDTAADIRDTDQKDEEISRFLELLERTAETLPVDSSLEVIPPSDSISGFTEIKISNAIGAFTFGEDIGSAGDLIIGLQPQDESDLDGQFFEIAISRDIFAPQDTDGSGMVFGAGDEEFLTADAEGRYWLPLVGDIISATWRYWDEENGDWLSEWEEENLPALLEFVIEDSHRPGPARIVIETPLHLVTGDGISPEDAATPPTNTTNTNTTSTSPPNRGGGGRRGGDQSGGKGGGGGGKAGKGGGPRGGGDGARGGGGKGGTRPAGDGGARPNGGGAPPTSAPAAPQ